MKKKVEGKERTGRSMNASQFTVSFVLLLLFLYVLWSFLCSYHHRGKESDVYGDEDFEEPFVAEPDAGSGPTTTPVIDPQHIIDFSDVIVTDEQREEWRQHVANTSQIQTVNERFKAAKRRTEEYKLKPGVYTNRERRRLIETLTRRPYCGKRARAWRTAFSDTLRGDVIPKNISQSNFGMMRIGRRDPKVDLHQGALGPLSGKEGAWISEENIPENMFDDQDAVLND